MCTFRYVDYLISGNCCVLSNTSKGIAFWVCTNNNENALHCLWFFQNVYSKFRYLKTIPYTSLARLDKCFFWSYFITNGKIALHNWCYSGILDNHSAMVCLVLKENQYLKHWHKHIFLYLNWNLHNMHTKSKLRTFWIQIRHEKS